MHNHNSISSVSATCASAQSTYTPETTHLPVELREAVDAALQECFDKIYCSDELLGNKLTQLRGPLDSLSKRHGLLLEDAIAHAFAAAGDRYEVSTQVSLVVSKEAMALVESNQIDKLDDLNLPVGGSHGKRVIIDILAFDHTTGDLHVISVKRGGGAQGGQAARDARKDLTAAGLMLKNLMLRKGLPVLSVKKVLIDWYGRSGIVARKTVTRETVDAYFGLPIAETVEVMSAYMKSGIAERMVPRLLAAIGNNCRQADTDGQVENTGSLPEVRAEASAETADVRPSLAECLSVLPLRRQGRQMQSVGA
ncbi:hypothetical protein J0X15_01620 [Roseibium sp. CAU 1637]|uniref:Uncharacterized protein n=1 Tax=Roseibium limicola TaxID=2816037 RepID=A0A939EKI8_9HYPH|nr:hypothetical protein [Roseibium limicola]MBO0343905.1 hypothetical protein [Roseibium limicola]